MRIQSTYISVSCVLAVVVWDGRRDPIYNLSTPLSGIGNRKNESGDPWMGHVLTRYQQLFLLGESFPMMIRLVCFDPFLILMSDWLFMYIHSSLPRSCRRPLHRRMHVEQPTRQRKEKAAMHTFWTCITNESLPRNCRQRSSTSTHLQHADDPADKSVIRSAFAGRLINPQVK